MNSFKIHGGTSLSGTITPQGAKNEALQIICAVLLTGEKITIKNIPDIRDIRVLIDLIKKFGVEVNQLSRNDFRLAQTDLSMSKNRLNQTKYKAKIAELNLYRLAGKIIENTSN